MYGDYGTAVDVETIVLFSSPFALASFHLLTRLVCVAF